MLPLQAWLRGYRLNNRPDRREDNTTSQRVQEGSQTWDSRNYRWKTNEGRDSKVLYQIAEASRPLTAVSGTCDAGNWVVHTSGGFNYNLNTGGRTYFERTGGICELYLWVKSEDLNAGNDSHDFARQGR